MKWVTGLKTMASTAAALLLALATPFPAVASLEQAETSLREGRYDEAITFFEGESVATPTPRLYRGWIEAYRLTGRVEEALGLVEAFLEKEPASVELENTRGELLYATGHADEAVAAFERAVAGRASDRWTAELNLAVAAFDEGRIDEAISRFDRFIDVYNGSSRLSADDLIAVGVACRYLGVTDSDLFKDALRAFDEAKKAAPQSHRPTLWAGELFLEKYNGADATESFEQVLQVNPNHPEALLGLAKVKAFGGSSDAVELVDKALEINPSFVEALAFRAERLLGLEDYDGALEEVEKALAINPTSRDALPIRAAAALLSGDEAGFARTEQRALSRNPRDAAFYVKLAEIGVQNRLYAEAADFAQKAVDLDERSWSGYGELGLNQLRLGKIQEGIASLERSFEGDPYNVWIKNTLDLIDTFPDYETTTTDRFEIFIEGSESELLRTYVAKIADEAYERLSEQYQYRAPIPIRLEIYPSHGDFSVRTLGLPGLGALGVCFGSVIALDSPSARSRGQFNWASTLWHELAHTVTLGMTDHKVPRWASEGLSVLEERRARPGWGDDVNIGFLAAYKRDQLLPLGELNNGFMRPTYPEQIGISYYQASLVWELIENEYGFQAIRDILDGYRRGLTTEEAFQSVLNLTLEAFDEKFFANLEERFGTQANALRLPDEDQGPLAHAPSAEELRIRADADDQDFIAQLGAGRRAFADERYDEAKRYLERAKKLFPEYAGEASPYWLLAQIHEKQGDDAGAIEELSVLVDINENHYDAHVKLAELLEKTGEKARAADVLERAIYIYPFEIEAHRKLADLYREVGRLKDVVVERQALLALTTDRAQGYYELAKAYHEAGERSNARRELLRALEIAPGFKEGLALLLELSSDEGAR